MIKIKSVRYFETRRGLGYEAKTDKGSIWNDGNGGATYFEANYPKYHNKDFWHLSELHLESLIDDYENVGEKNG
jgi:hypothetical protein|tara:strand:+ start:670 stop:891 length:222 start_codon:yes stop_codon:yes gene_type:complete